MKTYPDIITSILQSARLAGKNRISLVDVIWEYDAKNKLPPLIEEINESLEKIDWICTSKVNKELFLNFTLSYGTSVKVSESDFKWADGEYRRRFSQEYNKTK